MFFLCRKSCCFFLFTVLYAHSLFSQGNVTRPLFRHLDINDGLSQNTITCIIQDFEGYMWFGTKDGLNRYDGHTFKVYKNIPRDSTSLGDNRITCLYEDDRKNLWVGTMNGGLHLYDPETDSFIKIKIRTDNGEEQKYVVGITGNSKYGIWINFMGHRMVGFPVRESFSGNTAVSPTDISGKVFGTKPQEQEFFVTGIYLSDNGLLWCTSKDGLVVYDLNKNRIYTGLEGLPVRQVSFGADGKKVSEKNVNKSPMHHLVSNPRGEGNEVWMSSADGLYYYSPSLSHFVLYKTTVPGKEYYTTSLTTTVSVKKSPKDEKVWMGLYWGVAILNLKDTTIQYFFPKESGTQDMVNAKVSIVYKDRQNSVWMGSGGDGINYVSSASSFFQNGWPQEYFSEDEQAARSVVCLFMSERKQGPQYFLLGTYGGKMLTAGPGRDDIAKSIVREKILPWSASEAPDGTLYISELWHTSKYDPVSGKTEKLHIFPKPHEPIGSVYADEENNVWYLSSSHLYRYNPKEGTYTSYVSPLWEKMPEKERGGASDLYERMHSVIIPDGKTRLWLGTINGLLHFDKKGNRFIKTYEYIVDNEKNIGGNEIKSLLLDPVSPEKYLWIGTAGGGLNRMDITNGSFLNYSEKDGLPNNTVYGLLSDKEGNLWLSTNHGISRFTLGTGLFVNFDVQNGLQSNEFNTGAYFKSSTGELFFGGINGFNRFFPEEIKLPQYAPPIVISSFKELNGKEENEVPVKSGQVLSFPYNRNHISITLSVLDYENPEKNRYAYRIVNRDTNWINLGRNRNVSLVGLAPGKYELQAKGTDSYGRWNTPVAELTIVVSPPWWNTWWMRTGYVALFAFALYYFWNRYKKRIKKEQQLEIKRKEAEAAIETEKVKSRFLANISHEFRTPLTLINGHLEVLKEAGTAADMPRFVEMERNGQRLLQLINQLLDLSRMESGQYKLGFRKGNPLAQIKTLVFSFHSLAVQNCITLEYNETDRALSHFSGRTFVYSFEILSIVLSNLVSNALKFTPDGGEISVETDFRENGLFFSVTDTGPGITEEHIPKIFDRFYQADNSARRNHDGSGIGLALVKEFTELHGGTVSVSNPPGKGCTFSVWLASMPAPETHEEQERDTQVSPPHDWAPEEPSTAPAGDELPLLLIVEDNAELRKFIKDSIGSGYRAIEAVDGEDGLEAAISSVPDIIVSDVMMPKMDGFEFCRKVKENKATSHIPVILLTALGDSRDKIAGLETGANDYLTKPFSPAELRLRLRNTMQMQAALKGKFTKVMFVNTEETELPSRDKEFIRRLTAVVEENLTDPQLGVDTLSEAVSLSSSQLNRKLKALTGQTPVRFILYVRLHKALAMLKADNDNVAGVAYATGFGTPSYFSAAFKKQFGFSPSEKDKLSDK